MKMKQIRVMERKVKRRKIDRVKLVFKFILGKFKTDIVI